MHFNQQYKGMLAPAQIAEGMNRAADNASRLYRSARLLFDVADFPTAVSLAVLAIEDAGKVSVLRKMVGNSGDFDFRELIPIEKIVEQLKLYLNTDGFRACRAERVKALMQTLESAWKHVAITMSERTRHQYEQELGEDTARTIFERYGVPLVRE